ncbi:WhiB family transcriptional regulator [Kitasatospora viridis]|uniref:Transcriptional regulator WhiB n=1 Tax=Kitasatospora viridis TaxID=281105 RepID=A0A561SEG4_9ACTN|nr:WhiB family transcriptional regulator [Kitasatospora viridis]TWF73251.1 WhiB family redox-sensing transcriptional regulator [Kitasatospora viridis]
MVHVSRLPGAYDHNWSWQLRGSCREGAAGLFFHPSGERGAAHDERDEAAKAVCAGCPVRTECRRYALAAREPYGVWGGLTEDERHRLLSRGLHRQAALA